MELRPGTLIASTYEILGPLGRGGMGELFKARNARTERRVALKLLRPDAKTRADSMERFRREARAAGMINSDHVTQVLDIQDDPAHGIAIAFELLEGENLLDRLRRTGPMTLQQLHPIVEQILRGLCDAHAVGIIHRDLKPSNIFLEQRPDGSSRVKILDFGISKLPKTIAKTTLTEPGQALGSFMFMPPEQIQKAANVDARADVYALGTLAFQALTGHLPYSARSMVELVQMKTSAEARSLGQASGRPFAPELEAWVARCIARDINQRFQTAPEAAAAWRALMGRADLSQSSPGMLSTYTPPPSSQPMAGPGGYVAAPSYGGHPTPVPTSHPPSSNPMAGGYGPPPGRSAPTPVPPSSAVPMGPQPAMPVPYQTTAPSAPGYPVGPGAITNYPLNGASATNFPSVAGTHASAVGPHAVASPAPQRKPFPWLLVLAISLVLAASGVLAAVAYTLMT